MFIQKNIYTDLCTDLRPFVGQWAIVTQCHVCAAGCQYKDHHYAYGEEFHDGCESYCACTDSGVQCASIECPTDFGLDVLDPNCVDWETHPPDFKPSPPYCCPEQVHIQFS
jgi:hypothetical protein